MSPMPVDLMKRTSDCGPPIASGLLTKMQVMQNGMEVNKDDDGLL